MFAAVRAMSSPYYWEKEDCVSELCAGLPDLLNGASLSGTVSNYSGMVYNRVSGRIMAKVTLIVNL